MSAGEASLESLQKLPADDDDDDCGAGDPNEDECTEDAIVECGEPCSM